MPGHAPWGCRCGNCRRALGAQRSLLAQPRRAASLRRRLLSAVALLLWALRWQRILRHSAIGRRAHENLRTAWLSRGAAHHSVGTRIGGIPARDRSPATADPPTYRF